MTAEFSIYMRPSIRNTDVMSNNRQESNPPSRECRYWTYERLRTALELEPAPWYYHRSLLVAKPAHKTIAHEVHLFGDHANTLYNFIARYMLFSFVYIKNSELTIDDFVAGPGEAAIF
jgi:hypothetical protein